MPDVLHLIYFLHSAQNHGWSVNAPAAFLHCSIQDWLNVFFDLISRKP